MCGDRGRVLTATIAIVERAFTQRTLSHPAISVKTEFEVRIGYRIQIRMDPDRDDRFSEVASRDADRSVEPLPTTASTTVTFLSPPSATGEACLVRIYPPG